MAVEKPYTEACVLRGLEHSTFESTALRAVSLNGTVVKRTSAPAREMLSPIPVPPPSASASPPVSADGAAASTVGGAGAGTGASAGGAAGARRHRVVLESFARGSAEQLLLKKVGVHLPKLRESLLGPVPGDYGTPGLDCLAAAAALAC